MKNLCPVKIDHKITSLGLLFSMKVELMRHYRILSNFDSTEVPSGLFCDCVVEDSQGMEVCVDIFA